MVVVTVFTNHPAAAAGTAVRVNPAVMTCSGNPTVTSVETDVVDVACNVTGTVCGNTVTALTDTAGTVAGNIKVISGSEVKVTFAGDVTAVAA